MVDRAQYAGFLGSWILLPDSCQFEQGEPHRAGTTTIREDGPALVFELAWTDAEGDAQRATFAGVPDGQPAPFDGGPLADALSVTAVAPNDLRIAAFHGGRELMTVQRQLDRTGQAMRVVQVVRLPDGTAPANISVFRRAQ